MKKIVKQNGWKKEDSKEVIFNFGSEYMTFIDKSKTERVCNETIIKMAEESGFVNLEDVIKSGASLKVGDKIYTNNRDHASTLFVIGSEDIEKGVRIIGSHIDSPRIDLKPSPVYEEGNMCLLKTHYYGGIKKYQWATIPLSMYGTVVKRNGEKINIAIGDKPGDPVFFITDLLIHLSSEQMKKTLSEGIEGEQLNVLCGHIPLENSEEKELVKENVLSILSNEFNIEEEDFITAEIEIVPQGRAMDVGFDRGVIAAYGHDDRVCAFASLKAILEVDSPKYTVAAIFADKEETGSNGSTGMHSQYFTNSIAELINIQGNYSDLKLRRAMKNSKALSADVNHCYDPTFASVSEVKNTPFLGEGVVLTKYTGSRGKGGCNDSTAEFVAQIAGIFDEAKVVWQTGELGKVDQGGGGTIAYILAEYDMDVIDCGTPVLSMHAPYELISKVDLYNTYKGYKAFYNFNK
ncbi:MAG: aminopeptidase [Filifactoraceae bacterium]